MTDVVLAYQTAAVFADPDRVDFTDLESRLRGMTPGRGTSPNRQDAGDSRPLRRSGLARRGRQAVLERRTSVIALHCQVDYHVFAIGFLPGFPYAGYLPPALAGLARRDSPRLRVPAGSVAIAGRQTGSTRSTRPAAGICSGQPLFASPTSNPGTSRSGLATESGSTRSPRRNLRAGVTNGSPVTSSQSMPEFAVDNECRHTERTLNVVIGKSTQATSLYSY